MNENMLLQTMVLMNYGSYAVIAGPSHILDAIASHFGFSRDMRRPNRMMLKRKQMIALGLQNEPSAVPNWERMTAAQLKAIGA